jgi:phage terminase large subunit
MTFMEAAFDAAPAPPPVFQKKLIEVDYPFPKKFEKLFTPAPFKAFFGGRGGGKSINFANAALLIGALGEPKRILCCREIQKSLKDSVKKTIEDQILALNLHEFYWSTVSEIRGINGTVFQFEGLYMNVDNIKSKKGIDICWVEEAQSVSHNSIDILLPTIREPGAEIWFSWNPRYPTDAVDMLFRSQDEAGNFIYPPGSIVEEVNWSDNPYFPIELERQRVWMMQRDPEKYQHIWEGKYETKSESRVFKNWRVGSRSEFLDYNLPDNDGGWEAGRPHIERYYQGADWGYANDPTVLVRLFVDEENRKIFIRNEAWKIGLEIDRTPDFFNQQIKNAAKWPTVADSARPETISYMKRHGFPHLHEAMKGAGSVEDGIEFLKSYDIIIHPDCKHCIEEFTLYSWKTDKDNPNEILPVLEDNHNHVIDAVRYALESYRKNRGFGFTKQKLRGNY